MTPVPLFSALADPTRLRVVELLHEAARPVHELAAVFAISRPAISRHLRVLKEAGLVREVKQGRENVYSLQHDQLKPAGDWLAAHRPKLGPARAKPAKADKPRAVRPRVSKPRTEVVAPSSAMPPAARPRRTAAKPAATAPQLSFFDL